ncbi:MAG: hypothetical protein M3O09_18970 [Acidobacteriota bacterium]|nr:hypothetical protein [Acidobacteriota bacterium]
MRSLKRPAIRKSLERIATAGEVFADGTLIELLRDDTHPAELRLLISDGKNITIARRVRRDGRFYVPADLDAALLRMVCLPGRAAPYGSVPELFNEIARVFIRLCDLPEEFAELATAFVFSTWFADCVSTSPRLCVVGHGESGIAQFLRVLGSLTRHGMLISDAQPSKLIDAVRLIHPTLVLYPQVLGSGLRRLLHATRHRGFGTIGKESSTSVMCAVAVYGGAEIPDGSYGEFVQIPIAPTPKATPLWNVENNVVVATLQSKLLTYRLEHRARFSKPNQTSTEPLGSFGESAYVLASFIDDPELQKRILGHLRRRHQVALVDRAWGVESLILEALLFVCHEQNRGSVHVGEVTNVVNSILSFRGESLTYRARKIGAGLTKLGVVRERDRNGYGFYLSNETRRRIHDLAGAYDVPSSMQGLPGCDYCHTKKKSDVGVDKHQLPKHSSSVT